MEKVVQVLEKKGYRADQEGIFHIRPRLVPMKEDIWEKITSPKNLFGKPEGLGEILSEEFLSGLCRSIWDSIRPMIDLGDIQEYVSSHVRVEMSEEDWWETPVRVNIGLLVDAYHEYTLNVTYPSYDWPDYAKDNEPCFDDSSIMWLTRRQGYKRADLRRAQYRVERAARSKDPYQVIPSPYLYSAAMEIWHEMSIFNKLGFFVLIPLQELWLIGQMQLFGSVHGKWPGYLLLDKGVSCGFFFEGNGSCSLLGIELEKNVKLPLDKVEVFPDGGEGYPLFEVMGDSTVWKADRILHWGMTRSFRREAARRGIELPDRAGKPETPKPETS